MIDLYEIKAHQQMLNDHFGNRVYSHTSSYEFGLIGTLRKKLEKRLSRVESKRPKQFK